MLTLALALATLLAAAPQNGVVYTADGGRLRGSVLEAGPGGVSVQLTDGSTRRLDVAQVSRVDFADGTTWSPKPAAATAAPAAAAAAATAVPAGKAAEPQAAPGVPPQPNPAAAGLAVAAPAAAAPASAAAPAAAGPLPGVVLTPAPAAVAAVLAAPAARAPTGPAPMVALPEKLDTVFLAKGGRVRGLVVEETQDGVVMRLVDGAERRFAPGQVIRVEYANGTTSVPPDGSAAKPAR